MKARMAGVGAAVVLALGMTACGSAGTDTPKTAAPESTTTPASSSATSAPAPAATLTVTSSAFADGADIPVEYTCDGDNRTPPLTWTAAPPGTDHLRLDVFDPDAPGGGFVHWRVDPIPPTATSVPVGTGGWRGPCPPKGATAHHYVFTVTALDDDDHPVATGRLVGLYRRR